MGVPVSMRMDSWGNWNLLIKRYFMHFASLMQPLSSCLEYLYDIPTITAFFLPCAFGGGPGGAWPYGEGGGGAWGREKDEEWDGDGDGGAGALRGSATWVTAWQRAQRIAEAPAGSCKGVWQLEQFTSIGLIIMVMNEWMKNSKRVLLGFKVWI